MSRPFRVGDRVVVVGGYDNAPAWLQGGDGYCGTLVAWHGGRATVELDDELDLRGTWSDFGSGSSEQLGTVPRARGRWLALALAWVDTAWEEPIPRLHVSVCADPPDLAAIPPGGGVGAWVESHATMRHE